MTYNEVYDHLIQVRLIDKRIWLAIVEHDELQSCLLPKAITYDKDIVQVSPEDNIPEVVARVLDLEKKIRKLMNRKAQLIISIREEIGQLPDEDQREILIAFFLARQPMREIAMNMGRSVSGVYAIRRKGIQALRDIL